MRDAALLGARLLLGGYMGIHASQKLFGKFNGPGLDGIGAVFEKNGLTPGREMAMAAHNREGGLMANRGGVELPVAYLTLALTLAAAGPGKYKIGPSLSGKLAAAGFLLGGVAAGALIGMMLTSKPALAEAADGPSAANG
jgi:putative oxidoreductase